MAFQYVTVNSNGMITHYHARSLHNYPNYFRNRFGIGFPDEVLKKLEKKGYIRQSTAKEALPHLKVNDLKAIASRLGIKVSGKKEEICVRIVENASEEDLVDSVLDRYWAVTDKGSALLEENKHISFYMDKHPYNLENIGLDINAYAKLFTGSNNGRVRDVLWGEFNRKSLEFYQKGMAKGEFKDYCELLRIMALFLEEDNFHVDALRMYMRYIHYRANFNAGLAAIRYYSLLKDYNGAVDTLFMEVEILPFIADEIQTMSNGCGFDSKQLYSFMKDMLSKEKDTGVFSPTELTDLVMYGLNGNKDGQKKICRTVMKTSANRIQRR